MLLLFNLLILIKNEIYSNTNVDFKRKTELNRMQLDTEMIIYALVRSQAKKCQC